MPPITGPAMRARPVTLLKIPSAFPRCVLLDANGLRPNSTGWRFKWSGGKKTTIDGPFTETKELVAGYTIIQTKSREEAFEWTKRFPNPHSEDGEIEVRQMFELEDFEQGEAIDRFRKMGVAGQK
jgi:hypothetical protein